MTAILGFNAFHADSAACLVIDGKLVGAVAEERLGIRRKHTSAFPVNAIRWLLSSNGLRLHDITHVAVPRDTSANRLEKMRWITLNPRKGIPAALEHLRRSKVTKSILEELSEAVGEDPGSARFQTVNVEHHLAHIASAYYVSPFEQLTAGFSYDASGDFVSAMAARCEGSEITIEARVHLPHSLGFFYTAMCQFIGFDQFGEEYKVMGLAPYGEDHYHEEMEQLVATPGGGWFRLADGYFGMHGGGESGALSDDGFPLMGRFWRDKLKTLLGEPTTRGTLTQREKDIARSTQVRFETAASHCLQHLYRLVPTERLVMAGGCALNGVANSHILRDTRFRQPYLQAAASDDGTCIGAAFHCWHRTLGRGERFHMQHAFWGPEYDESVMRRAAEATHLPVEEHHSMAACIETVADLISLGAVVGWYQGRSEWGPRALGNRSILANPAIANMKDTINAKIKRRESFRPFAPSVLTEDVSIYFEQDVFSPFMMHVVKFRPEWRERLPAVTHIDGTGRLQSVDSESNPLYHALITAVKRRTGIGIVLNTSFNENEPVVDTPEQAVACFMRTDIDALCLGRYVIRKSSLATGETSSQ